MAGTGRTGTTWPTALGRVLGAIGIACYNWWIYVLVKGGMLTTPNEFFSDLEAGSAPHAQTLRHLDVVAGALMAVGLLLRGRTSSAGARREWRWLVLFAVASIVGGLFAYSCAEGVDATCRSAEWRLHLGWRHYAHVVFGIVEFACATTGIWLAQQRPPAVRGAVSRLFSTLAVALLVAYPMLAVAYLTDRLGAFIEPVFFVGFSVAVLAELFEPAGPVELSRSRPARTSARLRRPNAARPT